MPLGIGVLTGDGSPGRPMMFELEGRLSPAHQQAWWAAIEAASPELARKLTNTWRDTSPSGGHHWYLYLEDTAVPQAWASENGLGSVKEVAEAFVEATADTAASSQVLAEVIGAKRYSVVAPTTGRCSKRGRAWTPIENTGPSTIQTLSASEARMLLSTTRDVLHDSRVDALKPVRQTPAKTGAPYEGDSPLRAYSLKHTAGAELQRSGWSVTSPTTLRRPGGANPSGATLVTRDDGIEVATIWTADDAILPAGTYDAADIRARRDFGGNRSAASKALLAEGYGSRSPRLTASTPAFAPTVELSTTDAVADFTMTPAPPQLAPVTPINARRTTDMEPADPYLPPQFDEPHLRYSERAMAERAVTAAAGDMRALHADSVTSWLEWRDGEGWVAAAKTAPVTTALFRVVDSMHPGVKERTSKSTEKEASA